MLNLTINRHLPTIRAMQSQGMGQADHKDHKLLTTRQTPAVKPPQRRTGSEPYYLRTLRSN